MNKLLVPKTINCLKSYINNDSRNGEWLIKEFSNWQIIEEMLLQVQGQEMPKLTVGLLYCAMITIYDKEKEALVTYWADCDKETREPTEAARKSIGPLGNFILLLLHHIYDMKAFTLNVSHYF